MISVYVLDQIKTVRLYCGHYFGLFFLSVLDEFYRFLNHPTTIAIFRKIEQICLDYFEETFLMVFLSTFKNLLEDVIAKLVLGKLYTLLEQDFEDSLLGVGLTVLYDVLHCSGTILVTSPSSCLLQIVQNFLFWCGGRIVLRHRNTH